MSKRRSRQRNRYKAVEDTANNVVAIQEYEDRQTRFPKAVELKPRNIRQADYLKLLQDWSNSIIFALGPAGTGKTMLAVHKAIEEYKAKRVQKIVITRPAVSVDEEHGFLPGDLIAKMTPWMRPVFDIFYEHFSVKQTKYFLENEIFEVCPLAYMRGRTFKNSFIIADEMQNATPSQMKMLLTRIGERSKMVVTGDLAQHDRGYENNGLADFISKLNTENNRLIKEIQFDAQHIERHPAVSEVLKIYGDIKTLKVLNASNN